MGLTMGGGPLTAKQGPPSNYEIHGPKHRLAWTPFPRRVRAELGDESVFDTTEGMLLHESEMLPVLYVPETDVRGELMEPGEKRTHCPFKGDATHWSLRAGDSYAADAVWAYPEPIEGVEWLRGHYAFYWDALDAWFDESERVRGHLRDPYHRIDVRRGSRSVTVRIDGEVIGRSARPWVLSETGIDNRFYLPPADVDATSLQPSTRREHCPYKGDSHYLSHGPSGREDVAWSYPQPYDDARRVVDCICFLGDGVELELD